MKTFKKSLALLLCAVMLVTALPIGVITASAETAAEIERAEDDYYYKLNFDGLNTGSISGNLSKFVESYSNPYGFTTGDTGGLSGKIIDGGNGDKYFRIDHTWASGATSGSWKGIRFTLNDGTKDHLITGGVETSFKFRWIGTGTVDAGSEMLFYKLRRHNGTDPSKASSGRLELTLLKARVDAETGDFVISAYTHTEKVVKTNEDGTKSTTYVRKYQDVYRFAKNSEAFSDISIKYYDGSATYSLHIDGKPVVESVYIGYANNGNSIDVRDPNYVLTTYDGRFYAADRQPVSVIEKWAIELFRISRGSIADASYIFDVDSFVMKKDDAVADGSYYYSNSFDTFANSDEKATAHNAFSRVETTPVFRLQGTSSNIKLAQETVNGEVNGYLDMGTGTRLDFLDRYQLFQDGNFTVSFKMRADDTTGAGTRLLNINPFGDSGTQNVLYITSEGYLYLGNAQNVIKAFKVPSTTSGEWLKVTLSVIVTNQNDNSVNFVGGKPLNGRICYALWLNDELCGIYTANDSGPYRSLISGSTFITNKNFTKTELAEADAPSEADLEGFTLSESESSDTFKVYRKADGSFYQLKGTTTDGVFTFSSGAHVNITGISANADSMGIFNRATNVSAHIDDLQIYEGIGPDIYARGKSDTKGVISSVNFAYLTRTALSNRSNSVATANVAVSLGGRDGFMQGDALDENYATATTADGKTYITLSNLKGKTPFYELHVTNSGGKMFSSQFTLRNLVSSSDVKLLRVKRQERTASTAKFLETLYAEADTGYLYYNDSANGKTYLVNSENKKYSVSGSEWVTVETIVDERGDSLLVTYLINGECAYFANDQGLIPAKSVYLGSIADSLYSVRNAIDQRIVLYRIDTTDENTSLDILSAKIEYTDTLPDAEAIIAGLYDMDSADYSGKQYSAKITMSKFAPAADVTIIRPIRQFNVTTPTYSFDTLFVEAKTGDIYFEHYDGTKYYLVNEQRARYSVAGDTGVTPEIIFNETSDKILVTFLVDGKVAYYDSKDGLVPARELYIGGDVVHALKGAALQKIRFYHNADDSAVIDNETAKLEVVTSVPSADEIKWEDSVYLNFANYSDISALGDQFEWNEGVSIDDGVLKISSTGKLTWVDRNGVLADFLDHYLGAVNGQYVNGFTIEMKAKVSAESTGLVALTRGSVTDDRLIYLNSGYVHMSGGSNSGYMMNLIGSDRYTEISANFTVNKDEVNVFADGYLLGISRCTSADNETEREIRISIIGECELSELRIHRDLEREFATESGEIFKLDADMYDPVNKTGSYRSPTEGAMAPGVLKNPTITTRKLYTDSETGENFHYWQIAPNGTVGQHTHTDFYLNGYLEDKVTVFEYDFRFTPGVNDSSIVEMCYVRRAEENTTEPLWHWLFSINSAGNYSIVNSGKLCDAEGNLLVSSSEDWNKLAIVYDVDAGLVSYRLNGKIPYYIVDGGTAKLAHNIQLPTPRYYRMDSAETQLRTVGVYAGSTHVLDLAEINVYTVDTTANAEYIGVQAANESNDIRVVAGLDMLYYGAAGFDVVAFDALGKPLSDEVKTYYTKEVYSSIVETTANGTRNIYPEDFGYRYFLTANIEGVTDEEIVKINVTPFTVVNGEKYCSSTVTLDVDFNQAERKNIATTKSVDVKPEGTNTSGNFSTTEVVAYTNDGALEFNGLDAEFAFAANLEGGVVSVNLANAYGEVAQKTVLDVYVDGVLTQEGVELEFGRHTLVLAEGKTGEHTFKIVKRSGGDFVCINSMSFCGAFAEKAPALSPVGAVNVEVKAPASGAEHGNVYVYVQTSDESGDYYIRYNFIYLNFGIDSKMVDGDNSVNPSYSSGDGNTKWNCHMYRVKEAFLYKRNADGSYSMIFKVLHQGEISVAIKESFNGVLSSDFVGGYHGDENALAIQFLVDGKPLDTTKEGTYNNVTTIELLQESLINRCNEPDTPLLKHNQHFLLDTNGLRIDRNIEVVAKDFSPNLGDAYTMMATVYRINTGDGIDGTDDDKYKSVKDAANVTDTFNIKTMNILNANGELPDDSSVYVMEGEDYSYISNGGKEKTTTCAHDTRLVNRYAEYLGEKGLYGRVGYVVDDASMEAKSVRVAVRLTYGDNKWYASVGSYSSADDGDIVPRGEKWNLSTYYFFDYDTAKIVSADN